MKKSITIFASIILMTLSANVMAQNNGASTASATATSTATIVTPISIEQSGALAFGKIAANASTAGTVTLTPDGTRSNTGGTSLIASTTGVTTFNVSGQGEAVYSITLPSIATVADGSNSMDLDQFTNSLGATSTLSETGSSTFTVGATLNVDAAQPTGNYTGTYVVTVSYN